MSSKLPNGYVVQFVAPLKRAGAAAPTRFLVLGRKPSQHGLRPIVCAGNVFGDRLDVDSGVMEPELRTYVLRAFAHWLDDAWAASYWESVVSTRVEPRRYVAAFNCPKCGAGYMQSIEKMAAELVVDFRCPSCGVHDDVVLTLSGARVGEPKR